MTRADENEDFIKLKSSFKKIFEDVSKITKAYRHSDGDNINELMLWNKKLVTLNSNVLYYKVESWKEWETNKNEVENLILHKSLKFRDDEGQSFTEAEKRAKACFTHLKSDLIKYEFLYKEVDILAKVLDTTVRDIAQRVSFLKEDYKLNNLTNRV